MQSLHRLVLAAILASAAGPAFAGWGPGGHDDAIYPEDEPIVTVGGESLTYGPGIAHDDAIYAQGPVQREVPDIDVPRGPSPAGKDDTMYAGDYLPEQLLPVAGHQGS